MFINAIDNIKLGYFTTLEIERKSHYLGKTFYFNDKLLPIMNYIREELGSAVYINSANRSDVAYNKSIGGASNSQHIYGNAVDLSGVGLVEFVTTAYEQENHHWQKLVQLGLNGLGFYNTFIHLDVRSGNFAHWDNRTTRTVISISIVAIFASLLIYKWLS